VSGGRALGDCPAGAAESALCFSACHYPHPLDFQLSKSKPSHFHIRRCQPRQILCQPGNPSCLRARKPPSRAVATRTFWLLQPPLGRPRRFCKIANASGPRLYRASAKVRHGNEVSRIQCSGSVASAGPSTSCASSTHSPRIGSCHPFGRQGPSKSTRTVRSSTIVVRVDAPGPRP